MDPRHFLARLTLVRNLAAGELLERFCVSGVVAVVGIRTVLGLTGYPRLGGAGLHIAHMLWGGLLMTLALVTLFTYLGQRAARLAAILAGLGFGTFIDELGKFLTADNNYFFRPTLTIIYMIFAVLVMFAHSLERQRTWPEATYLINAAILARETAGGPITAHEKLHADAWMHTLGHRHDALTNSVRASLASRHLAHESPAVSTARRNAAAAMRAVVGWAWTRRLLLGVLLVRAAYFGGMAFFHLATRPPGPADYGFFAAAVATLLTSSFTLAGCLLLGLHRAAGWRWLRRAALSQVLLVDVFDFYADGLGALGALTLDIAILGLLTRVQAVASSSR